MCQCCSPLRSCATVIPRAHAPYASNLIFLICSSHLRGQRCYKSEHLLFPFSVLPEFPYSPRGAAKNNCFSAGNRLSPDLWNLEVFQPISFLLKFSLYRQTGPFISLFWCTHTCTTSFTTCTSAFKPLLFVLLSSHFFSDFLILVWFRFLQLIWLQVTGPPSPLGGTSRHS